VAEVGGLGVLALLRYYLKLLLLLLMKLLLCRLLMQHLWSRISFIIHFDILLLLPHTRSL